MLVFTSSSLWEGLDSALGFQKHLGKWNAFTSIRLLKTLLLCDVSRSAAAAKFCVCDSQGPRTEVSVGCLTLPGCSSL